MATQSNNYLLGLWDHEEVFLHAIEHIRHDGIEIYETLTPFPVHGMEAALGYRDTRLHTAGFLFGATGTTFALSIMSWVMTTNYPLNFGGKPNWPLPSFIPITFEMTILIGSFSGAIGMILLNGLPQPYHPVFNVPRFSMASSDRFFLCIESEDPKFDRKATAEFLKSLNPVEVTEVEP